jgi:hypothetical protein
MAHLINDETETAEYGRAGSMFPCECIKTLTQASF